MRKGMHTVQKLPQNLVALIGDIGEKQVLLRLGMLCHQTPGWSVFHNLGEAGFDLLLLNMDTNERIQIEVKARQKIYTTGKNSQAIRFGLTAGEHRACHFLIAYFLDQNEFYIVPKQVLKPVSGGRSWRFVLTVTKQGRAHPRFARYLNAWGDLHPDFRGKSFGVYLDEEGDEITDSVLDALPTEISQ
jgi:hypothetical protein